MNTQIVLKAIKHEREKTVVLPRRGLQIRWKPRGWSCFPLLIHFLPAAGQRYQGKLYGFFMCLFLPVQPVQTVPSFSASAWDSRPLVKCWCDRWNIFCIAVWCKYASIESSVKKVKVKFSLPSNSGKQQPPGADVKLVLQTDHSSE